MRQTRVSGHALKNEGAPFLHAEGGRLIRASGPYGGVSGEGRGVCTCGAISDVLASATQRRKWHRAHKAEVTA